MEPDLYNSGAPTKAEFHAAIARRSDAWYSACLRITGRPDLAEDAVQDALMNAWRRRAQFESAARLETWVHRIAVNAALQLLRNHKPERFEALETEPPEMADAPHVLVADAQLQSSLTDALGRLSDMERLCFVLKHIEQWRLHEIARELDSSDGAVKQALFRAVKKLRVSMAHLRG